MSLPMVLRARWDVRHECPDSQGWPRRHQIALGNVEWLAARFMACTGVAPPIVSNGLGGSTPPQAAGTGRSTEISDHAHD